MVKTSRKWVLPKTERSGETSLQGWYFSCNLMSGHQPEEEFWEGQNVLRVFAKQQSIALGKNGQKQHGGVTLEKGQRAGPLAPVRSWLESLIFI